MKKILSRILISIICLAQFLFPLPISAQGLSGLIGNPYPSFNLSGLTIYPQNPLQLDFIIHAGQDEIRGAEIKAESQKLINYFFAVLTTPEKDLWVNLSPSEKDRIMAEPLSQTEIGRDMLLQDLKLKQLTARLTNPETDSGQKYWHRLHAASLNNLTGKVWIVPQKASVFVHDRHVFVTNSHLSVMMESEYKGPGAGGSREGKVDRGQEEIFKELILPQIEKEVNEGKDFANLRQIYHAMILATWYKRKLKGSLLDQVYIEKNKIRGIDLADKNEKEKIYEQYLAAFKHGAYSLIQEEVDELSGETIPKKYFSGGLVAVTEINETSQPPQDSGRLFAVGVNPSIYENSQPISSSGVTIEFSRDLDSKEENDFLSHVIHRWVDSTGSPFLESNGQAKVQVQFLVQTNAHRVFLVTVNGQDFILKRARDSNKNYLIVNQLLNLRQLQIPGVPKVLASGTQAIQVLLGPRDSLPIAYLIMEDMGQLHLGEYLKIRHLAADESKNISIAIDVLQILKASHQRGMIVADLKPNNIAIREKETVQAGIYDWDVSLRPGYDWEQDSFNFKTDLNLHGYQEEGWNPKRTAQGRPRPDVQADIFSMGMVMLSLFTQLDFFDAASDPAANIFDNASIKYSLGQVKNPKILHIIRRAIAPRNETDPDKRRYQTVNEMIQDLEESFPQQASSARGEFAQFPDGVSRANYLGRYAPVVQWLADSHRDYFDVPSLQAGAVIDVGTSYGYGAFEMANHFIKSNPRLRVYGVDPGAHVGEVRYRAHLPENLTFIQDDHRLLKAMGTNGEIKEPVRLITMFNVHFWYPDIRERQKMFRDLFARLEEGGILILGSGSDHLGRHMSFAVFQKVKNTIVPKELMTNSFDFIEGVFTNLLFHYTISKEDQKRCYAEMSTWIDGLLKRKLFLQQIQWLKARGIPVEQTESGFARFPINALLTKIRELHPDGDDPISASSSVAEVRRQITDLQSQLGDVRKPTDAEIESFLQKLESGEIQLSGEVVDVWDRADEAGKMVGQVDRRVVAKLGYVVHTAEAFVLTPEGKWLFPLRVPLSKETIYPYHIGAYGGYVNAGESELEAMNRELMEELGLSTLTNIPELLDYDVYDKDWDTVRQRKARFLYRLTKPEYNQIKKSARELNQKKILGTEDTVIAYLQELNAKTPGAGESFGMIETTLQELLSAPSAENPQSPNADKRKQNRYLERIDPTLSRATGKPVRMFLTPDNLDLALENDAVIAKLKNAELLRRMPGIKLDPKTGQIQYTTQRNVILHDIALYGVLAAEGRAQAKGVAEAVFTKLEPLLRSGKEVVLVMSPLGPAQDMAWTFLDLVAQKLSIPTFAHMANNREITYQLPEAMGGGRIHVMVDDHLRETDVGENFLNVIDRTQTSLEDYNDRFYGRTVVLFGYEPSLAAVRVNLGDKRLLDPTKSFVDWQKHPLPSAQPTLLMPLESSVRIIRSSSAATGENDFTKGGIDFNAQGLELEEQGDVNGVEGSFDLLKGLSPDHLEGIIPVIMNITPVTNFPQWIGAAPSAAKPQSLAAR